MKQYRKIGIGILTLVFLTSCRTRSILRKPKETYSQADITKIANWRFNLNLEERNFCELYILDGVPYDHIAIDSVLSNYDKQDIRMISFLKRPSETTWWNRNCDIIPLIQTNKIKQSTEFKTRVLEKLIDLYGEFLSKPKVHHERCNSNKRPMVIVWGKQSPNNKDIYNTLIRLKPNEIEFIAEYDEPHPIEYFPSYCAKNGVVEIFLK